MKFTIISDTHGEHEKLGVMSGEVLIHWAIEQCSIPAAPWLRTVP